ncbi:hypothetical protein [Pseudomonas sp. P8_250]|uniref:hypothetical protein n=1 Tax=Pseudomonas sp. P8_250 TaxID=3043446 RepID=UPI002A3642CD|nr:hypothetical protein [Pseudomonas sp. P8_250]MDX9668739.1 hypothetical protein [Pseudomonas sp. P8_250]
MAQIKKGSYVKHAATWTKGKAVSHCWHLDSNPVGLRVVLMEWENSPHEVQLIKGDGRKQGFQVLAGGVLPQMGVNVSCINDSDILKAANESEVDAACLIIQEVINQEDGGVAGIYFSDAEIADWATLTVGQRYDHLCKYVELEKAHAEKGVK